MGSACHAFFNVSCSCGVYLMEKIIETFFSLKIKSKPFVFLKWGLLLCVLIQHVGLWLDGDMMRLLFSDALALKFEKTLYVNFFSNLQGLYFIGVFFLLYLAILERWQSLGFFLLFVCELMLNKRFFMFTQVGDKALIYLCLLMAFLPRLSWSKRNQFTSILLLSPILFLRLVIYLVNFHNKLYSSWAEGEGFANVLNHKEMLREFSLSFPLSWSLTINYLVVVVFGFICITPLVPYAFKKTRNSLIVVCLIYHLVANLMLRLDWLSMPFIFLELSLWSGGYSHESIVLKKWNLKFVVGLIFVILGFFSIQEDLSDVLNRRSLLPFGHNWAMFAPPPPLTGEWRFEVKKGDNVKWLSQQEVSQKINFKFFQHDYKYFYNLRRVELVSLLPSLSKAICAFDKLALGTEITPIYQGVFFSNKQAFETRYPVYACE